MRDFQAPSSQQLLREVRDQFDATGVVVLRGTDLAADGAQHDADIQAMRKWAMSIMGCEYDYVGGANERGSLAENVYDTGAPAAAHIHYHHEMAYLETSVQSLGLFCGAALPRGAGGSTFLSDNVAATDAIMRSPLGKRLKEHGVMYIRCLTDREDSDALGVYNHWQNSFNASTPAEAEALANERGLEVEWGERRYMKTKLTAPAFEHFRGRDLLFTSMADDAVWFDSWPGMDHLPPMEALADTTQQERPLKMLLGDGSEFSRADIQDFVSAYDDSAMRVDWQRGDLLVFCNYRWAHGRPAYSVPEGEARELYVTMGPPFTREGQREA